MDMDQIDQAKLFQTIYLGVKDGIKEYLHESNAVQCVVCGDYHDLDNPAPITCRTGDGL